MQLEDVWQYRLRLQRAVEMFAGDGGQTNDEIIQIKDDLTRENELVIVLLLVAAAESLLQNEATVAGMGAGPLATAMTAVLEGPKRRGRTPQLREILNVWANPAWAGPAVIAIVPEFLAIQDVRHWLAHGRHWAAPKLVDPCLAWVNIEQLFAELGMAMPAQPSRLI